MAKTSVVYGKNISFDGKITIFHWNITIFLGKIHENYPLVN